MAISVNLSPRQFADATLVADVSGILAETSLPASLLILESTETAIIGDIKVSRAVLSELRRMGVRVALDDFSTGYSSLSHLSDLPIDTLPHSGSLIDSVTDVPRSLTSRAGALHQDFLPMKASS